MSVASNQFPIFGLIPTILACAVDYYGEIEKDKVAERLYGFFPKGTLHDLDLQVMALAKKILEHFKMDLQKVTDPAKLEKIAKSHCKDIIAAVIAGRVKTIDDILAPEGLRNLKFRRSSVIPAAKFTPVKTDGAAANTQPAQPCCVLL